MIIYSKIKFKRILTYAICITLQLPTEQSQQLAYLAKVIGVPSHFINGGGTSELEALASVLLYRHLDRFQKMQAMTNIQNLSNRRLKGKLIEKVLDTQVNPQWGIWSLSNEELKADQQFHDTINNYASWIGVTASAAGAKDLVQNAWKNRKLSKGGWVTLVIWGAMLMNQTELQKVNAELIRRSTLKTSHLYK